MEISIKIATAVLMFHIVNICSAYRIVSMGSTNNEVKINQAQKYLLILIYLFDQVNEGKDTDTDCEDGWVGLLDFLIGGGGAETSDDNSFDESPEHNIDGRKGRMVRMMKRSVQENKKRNCREKSAKKDRTDLVRIV